MLSSMAARPYDAPHHPGQRVQLATALLMLLLASADAFQHCSYKHAGAAVLPSAVRGAGRASRRAGPLSLRGQDAAGDIDEDALRPVEDRVPKLGVGEEHQECKLILGNTVWFILHRQCYHSATPPLMTPWQEGRRRQHSSRQGLANESLFATILTSTTSSPGVSESMLSSAARPLDAFLRPDQRIKLATALLMLLFTSGDAFLHCSYKHAGGRALSSILARRAERIAAGGASFAAETGRCGRHR